MARRLSAHTHVCLTATRRKTNRAIPPTGKPGVIGGISIYRLAEGKVAEGRTQLDELGLLTQLGVIPSPEAATA